MKKANLILLSTMVLFFYTLTSCTKETILPKETVTVQTSDNNTLIIDTVINRPYNWNPITGGQIKTYINLNSIIYPVSPEDAVDVYWGTGGSLWLRLPFIDTKNNITVNYEWLGSSIIIFAYGDSATLINKSYWDNLQFDMAKIKITKVK